MANAVTITLLAACTAPLIAPDDRKHVCQVSVEEKFGSLTFQPNPLSHPAGGPATGAAGGALAGLVSGIGPIIIVAVPLGAAMGAVYGAACGAASLSHPNAEADFQRILHAADAGSLKAALEADLNVPRAGCGGAQADASASVRDTVIEIEKIEVVMGCAFGKQEYWLAVKWRALTAASRRVLAETTTHCSQASFLDVDDWFADPNRAQVEIERVLAKMGERMAGEMLSPEGWSECKFRSGTTGEIKAR